MFAWLQQLFLRAKERAALLDQLEQQAHIAKEQLNASLSMACSSASPEVKVMHLELAKSKLVELQAIAAEHPKMRLTNDQEVDAAIKQLEAEFSQAGFYAIRNQSASAQVSLSAKARTLMR